MSKAPVRQNSFLLGGIWDAGCYYKNTNAKNEYFIVYTLFRAKFRGSLACVPGYGPTCIPNAFSSSAELPPFSLLQSGELLNSTDPQPGESAAIV